MYREKLIKIDPATYELPKMDGMKVPGLIIANEKLLSDEALEQPLTQVKNVAYLPGIVGYSVAMPDIHWGYGFPIGGVAATDAENGVISPGGVGYDINCGVRLAVAPIQFDDIKKSDLTLLLQEIFKQVPSGVGHGHRGKGVSDQEYDELLVQGSRFSIGQGFGFEADLAHTESNGVIAGADPSLVSYHAKEREENS